MKKLTSKIKSKNQVEIGRYQKVNDNDSIIYQDQVSKKYIKPNKDITLKID